MHYSKFMPVEFSRKPGALDEFERYKAKELRTFLLYTGLLCHRKVLDRPLHQNFMLLSVAATLLSNDNSSQNVAEAKTFVSVKTFKNLYRAEYLVYNVINLLHLSDDVAKFGVLDSFCLKVFLAI